MENVNHLCYKRKNKMHYFSFSSEVSYEEKYKPEHVYIFSGKCQVSNQDVTVTVKAEDLYKYNQGELIQRAFPYLTANEREWMMTGIFELSILEED